MSTAEKEKQKPAAKSPPPTGERVVTDVPITDIFADAKWNARSNWKEATPNEEDLGLPGMMSSIRARGQDTPVTLRLNPAGGKPKYALVTGFRRFEAISRIAAEDGTKAPTIRAEIRVLTEAEACALNARENTNREDFKVPDLTWAILRLASTGMNDTAISEECGKSQPYVSRLHRIAKGLRPDLMTLWRAAVVPLEIREIEKVSGAKHEDQQKIYKALCKAQVEKTKRKSDEQREEERLTRLKEKAEHIGAMFARLTGYGHLNCNKLVFLDCLDVIITLPAEYSSGNRRSVAAAAERGYKNALEAIKAEAEEENDEEEDEG